jgi:hypothetical protein
MLTAGSNVLPAGVTCYPSPPHFALCPFVYQLRARSTLPDVLRSATPLLLQLLRRRKYGRIGIAAGNVLPEIRMVISVVFHVTGNLV